MFRRIELGTPHRETFAEPTPLGLICLAIGCAALTPIAFGAGLNPAGLKTAAMFCLLFGAGGQAIAGLLNLANRNLYGGTLFTAFAFNWVLNWWVLDSLSRGFVPDGGIVVAAEVCFLIVFLVFTWGFGFYSTLLFAFLLDIDVLYIARLANSVLHTRAFDPVVAVCTVGLGAISLWIAFALLINPTAGRVVFTLGRPLFAAAPRRGFDASLRRSILEALYGHWREHGFQPLPVEHLEQALAAGAGGRPIGPELDYLAERGGLRIERPPDGGAGRGGARLTAAGIDFWEQAALGKDSFA
ncbi:MAG: acetate uptake transporter family protein [Acidobacteriota bacterium]